MASRHDRKRAERFAARGIGEADLPSAQTAYLGDGGGACCLCDTKIVHQYLLTFASGDATTEFFPVGSKCITDWMRAMPESVERDEAIARVRAAESVMRAQRKVLKAFEKAEDHDAAKLMRIFFRLPSALQADDSAALGDIGQRVTRYREFKSDSQRRYFASLVRRAARDHGVDASGLPGSGRQAAQPEEPPAVCQGDEQGAALMERYRALPDGFAQERGGPLLDIGSKVERMRSFASDGQRSYFANLVEGAELLARFKALPEDAVTDPALKDMGGKLEHYGTFRTARQRSYFESLLSEATEAVAAHAVGDYPEPPEMHYDEDPF